MSTRPTGVFFGMKMRFLDVFDMYLVVPARCCIHFNIFLQTDLSVGVLTVLCKGPWVCAARSTAAVNHFTL
jgi:hypothetical protein